MKQKRKFLNLLICAMMGLSLCTVSGKLHAESNVNVASVEGTPYATLQDAFTAAKDGKTIELLSDVKLTSRITLNDGSMTLDLKGHKISQVLNIDIGNTPSPIALFGANLTVKDSATNGEIFGYQTPIGVFDNSTLTLESGTLRGTWYGLSGNGTRNGTTINIKGGSIISEDPEASAIYHPQTGTLTITGGTIKGSTGIQMCSGTMSIANISGGTIEAFGEDKRAGKTGDGAVSDGAAISVVNRPGYSGIPSITIRGGTFKALHQVTVLAYTWKDGAASPWADAKNHVTLQGGSYSSSVSSFLSTEYTEISDATNYTITKKATNITLDQTTLTMEKGSMAILKATTQPVDSLEKIKWSSSAENIASVDSNGNVTAKNAGSATITVKAGNVTAEASVHVYEKLLLPDVPTIDPSAPLNSVTVGAIKETGISVLNETKNIINDILNGKETTSIDHKTAQNVKEALAAGKQITSEISIKALNKEDVSKRDSEKIIATITGEGKVAQYLDISVLLKTGNEALGNIHEFQDNLAFVVAIPETLQKEDRTFYVVRLHNGMATKIETTVDQDGNIAFETNALSLYALVYEDKGNILPIPGDTTPPHVDKDSTNNKIQTGDNNNLGLYISLMLGALTLTGIVFVLNKKKNLFKN